MEAHTQQKPKKIRRLQIGVNVLVQVVLVLFLVAAINSLGFRHYKRWDLSRDKKYTLSDKTKRFLATLKGKVRVTVFFSPNTPITTDVQSLLTEFQYAARGKIDIENIDPERNLSRAKEIVDKYKVVSDESLLVITSAMMDLVEGKKNTLGYVTGHKEPPISDASPISVLKTFIENENVKFQELNLFDVGAIPSELKAIMIDGPQYDFSDREMKLLRDFWEKQGRILFLLDPAAKTPKVTAFLNQLGVKVNDDRLMVFLRTGIQELALTRDVQAHFLGGSPITKRLSDVRALFLGGTSSITLEPERVRAVNIRLEPLIQAEKAYFAETDYNSNDQSKLQADATRNAGKSLTIAASLEKGGSADERVQVNSARMVIVSNATFVQDNALTQDQQALDFISGSVNWLLSREQLIGIAPKVPKTLTFSLNEDQLRGLRWLILVLLPLAPAVIGSAVWWRRRA
jgi:ABC-2 type transport system permease protein